MVVTGKKEIIFDQKFEKTLITISDNTAPIPDSITQKRYEILAQNLFDVLPKPIRSGVRLTKIIVSFHNFITKSTKSKNGYRVHHFLTHFATLLVMNVTLFPIFQIIMLYECWHTSNILVT